MRRYWTYYARHGQFVRTISLFSDTTVLRYEGKVYQVDPDVAKRIHHAHENGNISQVPNEDICYVELIDGRVQEYFPRYRRKFPPKTAENVMLEYEYKALISKEARRQWRECHGKDMYGRWINLDSDCHPDRTDWEGELDTAILNSDKYQEAIERTVEEKAVFWESEQPEYVDPDNDIDSEWDTVCHGF